MSTYSLRIYTKTLFSSPSHMVLLVFEFPNNDSTQYTKSTHVQEYEFANKIKNRPKL